MTISYSGNFINLLRRWKGSVWKAVWKELLVFLILYYIVRFTIIFAATDKWQMDKAQRIVGVVDSFTGKVPLHFLLGFYVGQVVTRWWAQVQAVPWPDDIIVWMNSFFFKNDSVTKAKRRTAARYLILCETLVLRSVSTRIRKRFPTIESLVKAELMTQEELELYRKAVVENTRWQLPLQWIINGIVVPAVAASEIPGAAAGTIIGKINDFRTALRNIFMYDWVCIPLVYTQTCSVVVYGYFAFCLVGHQYFNSKADLYFPFLTVLQFIFFVGWFKVAQDLMRPFGEDDDDVELNVVLDRHAAVAMNLADQICGLNPRYSWDVKREEAEGGDKDTDGGGERPVSLGGPDAEKRDGEDIDGVIVEDAEPPFLILPYSKASLRKPRDHFPKMHAVVSLKTPEEEQLVLNTTNPFISQTKEEQAKEDAHATAPTVGPYKLHKAKQAAVCEKNLF